MAQLDVCLTGGSARGFSTSSGGHVDSGPHVGGGLRVLWGGCSQARESEPPEEGFQKNLSRVLGQGIRTLLSITILIPLYFLRRRNT